MLTIFPELLNYAQLSPFILRLALALTMINLGYRELTAEKARWAASFVVLHVRPERMWVKIFGSVQIAGSVLLFIGMYTQAVALVFAILLLGELFVESRAETVLIRNFTFYFLLFVITISLLFSGAGMFAIDLPL